VGVHALDAGGRQPFGGHAAHAVGDAGRIRARTLAAAVERAGLLDLLRRRRAGSHRDDAARAVADVDDGIAVRALDALEAGIADRRVAADLPLARRDTAVHSGGAGVRVLALAAAFAGDGDAGRGRVVVLAADHHRRRHPYPEHRSH